MSALPISKMHGLGNDFVLIDARSRPLNLSTAELSQLADRHLGVGCDQILIIEAGSGDQDFAFRIYNQDGSSAGQCGNGARCVAAWLRRDGAAAHPELRLGSPGGPITARFLVDGEIAIAMGQARFAPEAVPIALPAADFYELPRDSGPLVFGAVSMGNPHAVIEVPDCDSAEVAAIGHWLGRHAVFPEGANVGFVQVLARDRLRLRVFERGVGETLACGSGSCAAVAVLARRGRVDNEVAVDLPGGRLNIECLPDSIWMTGPACFVFEGIWTP